MNDDELIERVRAKAHADRTKLPPCATAEDVRRAEAAVGFALDALHARLLCEVADGGFGPGCGGCYGIGDRGYRDRNLGGGAVEIRTTLGAPDGTSLPPHAIPLADLGSGAWALVDARSGHVLALDEKGVVETELDLGAWFGRWAAGEIVDEILFDADRAPRREGINPFTRKPTVFVGRGPLKGRLLERSSW